MGLFPFCKRVEHMELATEVKLFGKWSYEGVEVNDIALSDYMTVNSKKVFLPHSAGRWNVKRFRKAQCPLIERLTNSLMMHGRNNGKKLMAVRIIKHTFEIINLLTSLNPLQVFVDAIVASGPGGTARRQAVDVSPIRRVNQAIYFLTQGARKAAFRNIKTIAECLALELINASKLSPNSYAIKNK